MSDTPNEPIELGQSISWGEALLMSAKSMLKATWKLLMLLGTLFWIFVEYADIVMDFIQQRLDVALENVSSYEPNWAAVNHHLGYVDVFFPVNEFFAAVTLAFTIKITVITIKWVRNLSPFTS